MFTYLLTYLQADDELCHTYCSRQTMITLSLNSNEYWWLWNSTLNSPFTFCVTTSLLTRCRPNGT